MVEIVPYKKDMNFRGYDEVYEDPSIFEEVVQYLKPKLDGSWNILVLEPKLEFVRTCLDTGYVPSYVTLTLAMEQAQLEQLYMEKPKLAEQEKGPWQAYQALIAKFPVPMEDKAMRELYYRVGPNEDKLAEALDQLLECSYVNLTEINKRWAPVQRVYASQVVRTFLIGRRSVAWKQLGILESSIGNRVTFYAIRKYVRHLFDAKAKYLRNEEVKERFIDKVSVYDITLLYWLFEEATAPEQLYPIFYMYERRTLNNVSCQ